jgi:hypothetical protein
LKHGWISDKQSSTFGPNGKRLSWLAFNLPPVNETTVDEILIIWMYNRGTLQTCTQYWKDKSWSIKDSLIFFRWPLWSCLHGSWIHNYLCNQCLSPLMLWVLIPIRRGVLDTTLCDKGCQWLAAGQWFSPGIPISSNNKTDLHDITEILALNTITLNPLMNSAYNFNLYIKDNWL